jgi:CelD/BcsL family acetyltransferase involved in cellulose biosynthesis
MALDCTVVHSIRELSPFEGAWRDLLSRSSTDVPTLTPFWLKTWWSVFGNGGARRLRFALFTRGERLLGIAPLLWRPHVYRPGIPFRRLELMASGEREEDEICSEYLGVIAEREAEEAVAAALAFALSDGLLGEWDEIVLPAMAGDGPMPQLLCRALEREKLTTRVEPCGACPYIALPGTWDEYVAALPASGRYVVTRSLRDFQDWAKGSAELHEARTAAEVERGMDILKSLHVERWGERNVFRSSRFSKFHEAVRESLLPENGLELLWLTVRNEPIVATYNIVWKGKVYFYQSGRTFDVPKGVRPGIVLHAHAIRRAIAAGRREYDFLAGTSRYKKQLSTAVRPLVTVRAVRAPLRELVRLAADRGFDRARRLRSRVSALRATRSEASPS